MKEMSQNMLFEPEESPLRIMLTTEGTYPFHSGGVSTWCHSLIENLPGFSFDILSVESTPSVDSSYKIPANVRDIILAAQWSATHYAKPGQSTRQQALRRLKTGDSVVKKLLIPKLESWFYQIMSGCPDAAEFSRSLLELNRFWRSYDFGRSFRSRAVWQIYENSVKSVSWPERYGEKDLAFGLTLIQKLFSPLILEPPVVDVSHSTAAAFCSIPAIVAREAHGTPMLLSEHGVYLRERLLDLKRVHHSPFIRHLYYKIVKALVQVSYFAADRILPVCDYNSKWEEHLGVTTDKIMTVYNGVDPGQFSPVHRVEEGRSGRPTVVSLARIDPLKDIETLLSAANLVRRAIPNVRFKLFGEVWNESYFNRCMELHRSLSLEQCFEFAGYTKSPSAAYQEGDVVVLSSVSEAFPYAVVEAMMCGRPVVATDVGGVSEALSGCGLIVEPKNPSSLAAACIRLLNNKRERKQLAKSGFERARSKFTIDEMIAAYETIYREFAFPPAAIQLKLFEEGLAPCVV